MLRYKILPLHQVTTGKGNIGIGYYAGQRTTTSDYNIAIGTEAYGSTADRNITMGYRALMNGHATPYNIAIGHTAIYYPGAGGNGLQFPQFTGPLIGVPALAPLNGYFAGGGAGGGIGYPSTPGGSIGGAGGGGPSGPTSTGPRSGVAAVANSGGGGGGAKAQGGQGYGVSGGAGGSGIVVLRYAA